MTFLPYHQSQLLTFIFDFLGGKEERERSIKQSPDGDNGLGGGSCTFCFQKPSAFDISTPHATNRPRFPTVSVDDSTASGFVLAFVLLGDVSYDTYRIVHS